MISIFTLNRGLPIFEFCLIRHIFTSRSKSMRCTRARKWRTQNRLTNSTIDGLCNGKYERNEIPISRIGNFVPNFLFVFFFFTFFVCFESNFMHCFFIGHLENQRFEEKKKKSSLKFITHRMRLALYRWSHKYIQKENQIIWLISWVSISMK